MNNLNISQARIVNIIINDYDEIPLTLTYNDLTDPSNPVPIDLTTYAFSFDFKIGNSQTVTKNYHLPVGGPSSPAGTLSIQGTGNNVLNMTGMWADIKSTQVQFNGEYRLIQLVTDNNGNSFVHIIYLINAQFD